jgi:hypothetical protein
LGFSGRLRREWTWHWLRASQVVRQKGIKMKNVEMTREGNFLVIRVDMTKNFGPSASGKTTIIASTEGNVQVVGELPQTKIGLNIYTKT